MLTLILTSTVSMAFIIRPSFAENGFPNKNFAEKNGETTLPRTSQNKTLENPSQTSRNSEDKWNFSNTSEWRNFTYMDGNKTRLIVGVNGEKPTSLLELQKIVDKHQAKITNTVSIGRKVRAVVVELLLGSATAFAEETHIMGLASYIEPNMKVQAQFVPNDPYWSMQWGPQKIQADWAWNTTVGDSSVLVAVVDTGIDYTHPDLATNYVALGYDWVNKDNDPMDDHGHGTHCAGIIAAALNNSAGIAGLAQVSVMAEKVLDSGGGGYWDWVANGIVHAVDQGAKIISMSLGGYGDSELVHEAVRHARDAGVLVIAAAGNDNTNMKLYPAGYDEVIAVAATDQYDYKAWFSNWGDWIELAAPGVDIYSSVPWGYESWSGTSMATPHVSGTAALVWSRYPNKTRDWVRLWLRYTADDLGDPGFDVYYGYGRVNLRKAVEQSPPAHDLIAYEWRTPPYVETGASEIINATILNFGGSNETNVTVQLLANGTLVNSTSIGFLASGNSATLSLEWNPTVEGLYNVTLYVVPVPGETNVENNVVWKYIYVGLPVKAVVLHSAGNVRSDIITNWQVLNNEWRLFGCTMVYIDYTTLNKEDITYEDIVATEADVLIISCAYDPYAGWQFTDSEIEAIERYVHEGHGLIATAGTLYYWVPNNNKLAPLLGLNETIMWSSTGTDLLHLINTTHPIFTNVPNPLVFPQVGTVLPYDGRWDSNELVGGKYLALGHYQESAIVTFRGLAFISPWLEVIPPYYHHHLQLLYNAIMWSRYQKPEHELVVSLEAPKYLQPGESTLLNATISNMGLNNETGVELYLQIDGTIVNSTTIPELLVGASHRIDYLWAPSAEKIYNITAYSPPLPDEEIILNNVDSAILHVRSIRFVLWDDTKDTDGDSLTGNYLSLYQLLTANGFIVDELTIGPINSGLLANYDILVLMDPELDFSPSEITDIQNWVASGGALIVIPDGGYPPTMNTLMTPYGVQMTGAAGGYGTTTNIVSHPITQGVGSIYIDLVREISATPPSTILAWTSDLYAFLSATEAGEVVVASDSNIMDNDRLGMADNTQLMLNIFNWVGIKPEHEITVTLDAPTFLKPGDSVLLNATVRNRGLSNESNIELDLIINGAMVDSELIPELLTEASYTLDHLWTPVEGTYNITAYALPVPAEKFTANNVATKIVSVRPTKYVLFDQTHGTDSITYYNTWVTSLTDRGYVVETYTAGPITPIVLEGHDVFVIPQAYYSYTADELSAIRDFVFNGGGLLVIGDDNPSIYTDLTSFAGITWASGGWSGITTDITPHPVTSGVTSIYLDAPIAVMYVAGAAQDLVRDPAHNIMLAVSEQPSGKVIGFADEGTLWDYAIGQADNLRLANNMIDWLAIPIRYEHELAVSLDAPLRLNPSDSVLLNATVRNRGLNNETNVELYLLINGTAVNSTTIPELLVSESYTISYLWTPAMESLCNITAYAPPVPGEVNTKNNIVTKIVSVKLIRYVLFDQTHGTDSITYYTTWVTSLTDRGYVVETHTSGPITSSVLERYDVFVIPQAYYSYTVDELSTIQNFVFDGGGLLVIGDDYPSIYTDLTSFAGITWTSGGTSGITTDITPHPVTTGVASVYLDAPIAIMYVTGVAQDLVRDPAHNIMLAVSEQPSGKVIGFADEGTLWNYAIGQADNLRLANNMIDWLAIPPVKHDVAIIDVEPSPNEVTLGEPMNINVTAVNEGEASESFNVTAYASSLNSTRIYLDPSNYTFYTSSVSVGYRFNVTVWVNSSDPFDLMMWQVYITFNDDLINVTHVWGKVTHGWTVRAWPNDNFGGRNWDPQYVFYNELGGLTGNPMYYHWGPGKGGLKVGDTLFGDIPVAAPKKLCAIEFEIKMLPNEGQTLSCILGINNVDTYLWSYSGSIQAYKFDGYYAISSGVPPPPPPPGKYIIGTITVIDLAPGENITLTFTWNTTGVVPHEYRMSAEASEVPNEIDTADNTYNDGVVKIVKRPFASFTYLPSSPKPGETVTFNALGSTPDGGIIISYQWDFGDGNITATSDPIITHVYATGNIYNATLTITDTDGLTDSTWRMICVLTRDVAVVNVTPSTYQTYIGRVISINVTIRNEGEIPETFNVTVYYNTSLIGTQTVYGLTQGTNITLTFSWDTESLTPRMNYTIWAEASSVPFESHLADNTLTGGLVKIKMIGDVNGDDRADMVDIYLVALAFGSYPSYPRWNLDADIDGDNLVDMVDIYIVARNFGKP